MAARLQAGKPVEARDDAMQTTPADGLREEYDFSQGKRGAVVPHQGKTRITLWVDTAVLDWFRALAEREGRGYQTAMNAALRQYTQQTEQPLHELVRDVIRAELQKLPDLVREMWQATPGDMSTTAVPEVSRPDRVP